ncbi:MAG TPA: DJ-1/PfpI family protein [Chitinophagaceae bacterium]|nr:DJ-1/PfpI family protein [Chitinophagaceae bacterium]
MKRVLLLLAEGFEMFEASVFIDVIGWNMTEGNRQTELFTCGMKREVKTTFNQKVIVDYLVDEVDFDQFDALAIPGGFAEYRFYDDAYDEQFSEIIRSFHRNKKIIASVCTGALPIARTGILVGKKGTTYNQNSLRQDALRSMGVNVVHEPIVSDHNIITSWNPSTAIDVAFLLLEKLTDRENAVLIKKKMGFSN